MALINLMTQKMHKNEAMMMQLQRQASPTVPQIPVLPNPQDTASPLSEMGWNANHQAAITGAS